MHTGMKYKSIKKKIIKNGHLGLGPFRDNEEHDSFIIGGRDTP